jgi:predicted protein tyrosine phosphatase
MNTIRYFINLPRIAIPFSNPEYKPCVLISITDVEESPPDIPPCYSDVLHLQFHDIDKNRTGYVCFSRKHARQILDFYTLRIDNVKTFVIHCTAGISRSAAIAAALHKIYYEHDNNLYWDKYFPNMLVYSTLIREFYNLSDTDII